MTTVIDASCLVAALVDGGPAGAWAEQFLSDHLAAPHLLPAEVANILRRAERANEISADTAALAYQDLLDLRVEYFDYEPFAARIWDLRHTVVPYDAWYVAIAERINAPVATLDTRLTNAPGPRCEFSTPPLT